MTGSIGASRPTSMVDGSWWQQRAITGLIGSGALTMAQAPFTGHGRFVVLPGGIIAWFLNGRLTSDVILRVVMDDTLGLQFVQAGGGRRRITAHGPEAHGGGNLYAGIFPAGSRQVRRWRAGRPLRYAGFWIPPAHAVSMLFADPATRPPALERLMAGEQAAPFGLSAPMTPTMHGVMDALLGASFPSGVLRDAYEVLKLQELVLEGTRLLAAAAQPRGAGVTVPASLRHDMQIERAADILRRELADPPGFRALAQRVGISHNRLAKGFIDRFGCSPHAYGKMHRMHEARRLIRSGRHALVDVAALAGFDSQTAFSRAYRAFFGHPPTADRPPVDGRDDAP